MIIRRTIFRMLKLDRGDKNCESSTIIQSSLLAKISRNFRDIFEQKVKTRNCCKKYLQLTLIDALCLMNWRIKNLLGKNAFHWSPKFGSNKNARLVMKVDKLHLSVGGSSNFLAYWSTVAHWYAICFLPRRLWVRISVHAPIIIH